MTSSATLLQFDLPQDSLSASAAAHAVQYVPASIAHNGTEEIDTYFNPFIRKSAEKECLEATLRGRPLEGEILRLPEGFEAAVVQAGRGDGIGAGGEDRSYRAIRDGIHQFMKETMPAALGIKIMPASLFEPLCIRPCLILMPAYLVFTIFPC
jgi:hypothetical protein